jgi:DNA-binding transcriptional MocR family regulator
MDLGIEAFLGRWTEGPGPLHSKLSDAVRAAIETGHARPGARLPSERELAARLAVSRSTVVAAYDTLRADGLLESRQGSGTRVRIHDARTPVGDVSVPNLPVNPVYRTLLEDDGAVISLAAAILPAHPLVGEAVAATAGDVDRLLAMGGYYPAGLPALREALAESHRRDGTPTTADQILVTTGAQQAVNLATQLFVRPGDAVVVESPSFTGTLDAFRVRGGRFVPVPVDGGGVDVGGVADAVAAERPAAIYVTPSFQSPTGALLAEHRRRALAELVADRRVPLIEDNALEGAPLDDARLPPIAAYAPRDTPVLTAGSFSKVAWGGLRVGWLRGPAALISRLAELKAIADLGSPLFDQAVAARLVPRLGDIRADRAATLRSRLALVEGLISDALPDWRWRRPTGGPALWIELPAGTAETFAQVALRFGVEVVPGTLMSPTRGHERHLRLPITAEPAVLEETIRRLAAAWRAFAPADVRMPTRRPVVV